MANASGQSYAFAALSPVITGSTQGVIHAAELRGVLERIGTAERSPFARVPSTHFARWVVLDDVPGLGEPTADDHIHSKYLLFIADFDGERDLWLALTATAMPDTWDSVYAHCTGYPGAGDVAAFRAYMVRCQLDTTLSFAPFANDPLERVLRALDTQRRFVGFVQASRGRSAEDLQRAFREFMARDAAAPTPPPGSV
jgi:hypothetical protein